MAQLKGDLNDFIVIALYQQKLSGPQQIIFNLFYTPKMPYVTICIYHKETDI